MEKRSQSKNLLGLFAELGVMLQLGWLLSWPGAFSPCIYDAGSNNLEHNQSGLKRPDAGERTLFGASLVFVIFYFSPSERHRTSEDQTAVSTLGLPQTAVLALLESSQYEMLNSVLICRMYDSAHSEEPLGHSLGNCSVSSVLAYRQVKMGVT